jgi:hypothetical protein
VSVGSDSVDVSVASVRSPQPGFVAAVSVKEKPFLLSSIAGCVSAELDSQIAACLLCEGAELNADPDDYVLAVTQIDRWCEHDLASSVAGVGGSQARARKRILSRLDSAIQNAPPHIRTTTARAAARARNIATGQHGVALEAELESLAHSPLPDPEWLNAIGALQPAKMESPKAHTERQAVQIHALILLSQPTH